MDRALAEAWESRDTGLPLNTPYDMLILASIIEKEPGGAAERPEIAGVFPRRLQRGMRLQSDPTVIYGITNGKPHLRIENRALPAGPTMSICVAATAGQTGPTTSAITSAPARGAP